MQTHHTIVGAFACAAMLGGCAALEPPQVSRFDEPELSATGAPRPDRIGPKSCQSRDDTPAVIETVTEKVRVEPPRRAADGTILSPAEYRTETHHRIVESREEIWFETPCPPVWTPEFVASLQRALTARGLYDRPATGKFDPALRRAIRRYQRAEGLDSDTLSTAAAKRLGLVAYSLAEIAAG